LEIHLTFPRPSLHFPRFLNYNHSMRAFWVHVDSLWPSSAGVCAGKLSRYYYYEICTDMYWGPINIYIYGSYCGYYVAHVSGKDSRRDCARLWHISSDESKVDCAAAACCRKRVKLARYIYYMFIYTYI